LRHRLSLLGYEFDKSQIDPIYNKFLIMADAKKQIHDKDLLELVG